MTVSKRMVRVDELLRRELGMLCEALVVPQVGTLVTITKVQCAPDLRDAIVFFSVLGDDDQYAQAARVLLSTRKQLQHELSRRIILKYTPRLSFREDHSAERADRVLSLLDELNLPPPDRAPTPGPGPADE